MLIISVLEPTCNACSGHLFGGCDQLFADHLVVGVGKAAGVGIDWQLFWTVYSAMGDIQKA